MPSGSRKKEKKEGNKEANCHRKEVKLPEEVTVVHGCRNPSLI